jgi:polyketide synthase 13
MTDRYHDDMIEFEPRFATRNPDGGWGEYVPNLEIVPIAGDHIQVINEPYIAKFGAHMSAILTKLTTK